MTMITPSYLGDTIEYSSYASSLVPSSDPLVTAASVLEFALKRVDMMYHKVCCTQYKGSIGNLTTHHCG